MFDRGSNICSRCDIVLKGLPESKLTPKPRSSGPVSSSHPPPQHTPVKVEDKVTFPVQALPIFLTDKKHFCCRHVDVKK